MKNGTKNFGCKFGCAFAYVLALSLLTDAASAAAVVARNSRARPGASSRAPTMATSVPTASVQTSITTPTATETTTVTEPEPTEVIEEEIIIEDKSDMFSAALGDTGGNDITTDASTSDLAEMVRRQRAALDAAGAMGTAANAAQKSAATGANACDSALRACMGEKCGKNFTKCSGDTDMTWGDKMDTCRRNTKCTGREYQLFAAEIKADRDANAELAEYDAVIECGNSYHTCIVSQCGPTFSKCLGKAAGDKAINDCRQIAQRCTQQDSGLAARAMDVFGTMRQDAEVKIAADEQRLYELRDKMRSQCQMLGAMFDERTFDCVFTVNFFASNSTTPYASKKTYAGGTFDCSPDWFGIDVTTFKENAYRYAREQSSATSAMLGSGVGIAAGAITSGAIDRAVDRQKAKNALKDAEKQHEAAFTPDGKERTDLNELNAAATDAAAAKVGRQAERQDKKTARQAERAENKAARQETRQERKDERAAKKGGGVTDTVASAAAAAAGADTGTETVDTSKVGKKCDLADMTNVRRAEYTLEGNQVVCKVKTCKGNDFEPNADRTACVKKSTAPANQTADNSNSAVTTFNSTAELCRSNGGMYDITKDTCDCTGAKDFMKCLKATSPIEIEDIAEGGKCTPVDNNEHVKDAVYKKARKDTFICYVNSCDSADYEPVNEKNKDGYCKLKDKKESSPVATIDMVALKKKVCTDYDGTWNDTTKTCDCSKAKNRNKCVRNVFAVGYPCIPFENNDHVTRGKYQDGRMNNLICYVEACDTGYEPVNEKNKDGYCKLKETKPAATSRSATPVVNASATSDNNDNCASKVKLKYTVDTDELPDYPALYAEVETLRMNEYNAVMDVKFTTDSEGKCIVNGVSHTYKCNAGQTRRECTPQPCQEMCKPSEMALEIEAEELYVIRKIKSECGIDEQPRFAVKQKCSNAFTEQPATEPVVESEPVAAGEEKKNDIVYNASAYIKDGVSDTSHIAFTDPAEYIVYSKFGRQYQPSKQQVRKIKQFLKACQDYGDITVTVNKMHTRPNDISYRCYFNDLTRAATSIQDSSVQSAANILDQRVSELSRKFEDNDFDVTSYKHSNFSNGYIHQAATLDFTPAGAKEEESAAADNNPFADVHVERNYMNRDTIGTPAPYEALEDPYKYARKTWNAYISMNDEDNLLQFIDNCDRAGNTDVYIKSPTELDDLVYYCFFNNVDPANFDLDTECKKMAQYDGYTIPYVNASPYTTNNDDAYYCSLSPSDSSLNRMNTLDPIYDTQRCADELYRTNESIFAKYMTATERVSNEYEPYRQKYRECVNGGQSSCFSEVLMEYFAPYIEKRDCYYLMPEM